MSDRTFLQLRDDGTVSSVLHSDQLPGSDGATLPAAGSDGATLPAGHVEVTNEPEVSDSTWFRRRHVNGAFEDLPPVGPPDFPDWESRISALEEAVANLSA